MFLFLFFFALSIICSNNDSDFSDEKAKKLSSLIEETIASWNCPGLALGIVYKGRVVFKRVYGVRNIREKEKIDFETSFPLASLSKNLFVHLLAILEDQGKIKLNDKVRKFMPNFFLHSEEVSGALTMLDLVSHCVGLDHFAGDSFWSLEFSQNEMISALSKLAPVFEFKERYTYQNNVFGIAGYIISKNEDRSISQLFDKYIFIPLKMKNSSTGIVGLSGRLPENFFERIEDFFGMYPKKNFANPHTLYTKSFDPFVEKSEMYVEALPYNPNIYLFEGSTGVNSSISDLLIWVDFLLKNLRGNYSIISKESFQKIIEKKVPAKDLKDDDINFPNSRISDVFYASGYFIMNYGDEKKRVRVYSHMGGVSGVRSYMALIPDSDFGFVIISNFGGMRVNAVPEVIRSYILDLFLNLKMQDWNKIILEKFEKSREKFKRKKTQLKISSPRPMRDDFSYVGVFENDLYGKIEISREISKDNSYDLFLTYKGKKIKMLHWNGDEFSFRGFDLSLHDSAYDVSFIEFGGENFDLCYITSMHEGKDPLFRRRKDAK